MGPTVNLIAHVYLFSILNSGISVVHGCLLVITERIQSFVFESLLASAGFYHALPSNTLRELPFVGILRAVTFVASLSSRVTSVQSQTGLTHHPGDFPLFDAIDVFVARRLRSVISLFCFSKRHEYYKVILPFCLNVWELLKVRCKRIVGQSHRFLYLKSGRP